MAILVAAGQEQVLPVLAMTSGFSKMTAAVMIGDDVEDQRRADGRTQVTSR